ncbi:MAG: response regulator [Candidatus Sulfotelmatobacter sp.]
MKILLVEDSRLERHKIGRCLTDWRLDFVAVESGTEAIASLERPEPPNMILLDRMLPDLDGIDICRRTRANGARAPYIYIVMLTAKSLKQDLLIAMAAGADDYLAKPVESFGTAGPNYAREKNFGTPAISTVRCHSRFSD